MPVYKHTDKDGWYFRSYIDGRQYKRSGFKTKKEAIEEEAKFRANFIELEKQQATKKKQSRLTVGYVSDEYLNDAKNKMKITTISNYTLLINRHIHDFFGSKHINQIDQEDIQKWRKSLDDESYEASYKNKLLRILKHIFRYSNVRFNTDNRVLELEPLFRSDKIIEEKNTIYTFDDFNKFISVIDNVMFRAVFTLLFFTGLRIGELRALTWNDIDLEAARIHVNKVVTNKIIGYKGHLVQTPKTRSSNRIIDYPKDLVNNILIDYFNSVKNQFGFNSKWFVFGGTSPISETNLRRYKIKYAKLAGLHDIRIHDFRHSYLSLLYELGVDPKIAKEQAGHASISTTLDIYTKIQKKTKRDIIDEAFSSLKNKAQ